MRYTMLSKPERLPDLLRERAGSYFETAGLCFAPLLETTPAGACVLALYFQNRYEGSAVARVRLNAPRRLLGWRRHALPEPELNIACPGGAFGVARAPFPIPLAYQGRVMAFEVTQRLGYPEGRGELLRFRPGSPTGRVLLALPEGLTGTSSLHITEPTCELIWWPRLLDTEIRRLAA